MMSAGTEAMRPRQPITVARIHASLVTTLFTVVRYVLWRLALPTTGHESRLMAIDLRQAVELRVRVLSRPGMRAVMRRMLWRDLATLPAFLAFAPLDVARMIARRFTRSTAVPVRPPDDFPYPSYYLYDFHHQANGNLSWRAAATYEWQIRFLFVGCNHLMRQGVIDEIPQGDGLEILDVACGNGAWLTQARMQGRNHRVTGVDLSASALSRSRRTEQFDQLHQMNAEALDPGWTERFDIVTCVWLFHELPHAAQDRVVAEIARVLKPGGILVFMDAIQWSRDAPELFALMGSKSIFGEVFNEPYFAGYLSVDLAALFARHGLQQETDRRWFKSKVLTARKRM
jgi:ubiquinone/menaquinone biosynthesis C-methylase UbiE